MKMRHLNLRIVDIVTNVNKKRMLFGHLQEVNRGQSWTKNANLGTSCDRKNLTWIWLLQSYDDYLCPKFQLNLTLFNWVIAPKPPKMGPIELWNRKHDRFLPGEVETSSSQAMKLGIFKNGYRLCKSVCWPWPRVKIFVKILAGAKLRFRILPVVNISTKLDCI